MAQGFNPHRHRPAQADEARWAMFSHASDDPLPTNPEILLVVIQSLNGRVRRMARTKDRRFATISPPASTDPNDLLREVERLLGWIYELDRTSNKQLSRRIRLYLRVIALRDHWPDELEQNWYRLKLGHYEDLFRDELDAIENGKLVTFSCLPAVLRLQRDTLLFYMDYAPDDSPGAWLQRNAIRVHEELSFYHCACTYRPDLSHLTVDDIKGPGELIPAILYALHDGLSPSSIRQVLKKSSRPGKIPSFLT